MTSKEIKELIKLVSESELSEFKLKNGDFNITIRTTDYNKNVTASSIPLLTQQHMPMVQEVAAAPAVAANGDQGSGNNSDAGENANLLEVKSPIVGTFYRSSSPDKDPYISIGDNIDVGSVVCIVEAMKLFNEIESEVKGKVVKVMVDDASPIEYDQVLFLVDPKG